MSERANVYRATVQPKLRPAPFPAAWVRDGKPQAAAQPLWKSDDSTASTLIWECSAGTFDWFYREEETVHILEGEVDVVIEGGLSFRLSAGDTAVFRAGCHAVWSIPNRVRKIAIVRLDVPGIAAFPMRAWRKVTTKIGGWLGGKSETGLAGT